MKMPRTFRGPVLWLCFSDEASASQSTILYIVDRSTNTTLGDIPCPWKTRQDEKGYLESIPQTIPSYSSKG